MKLFRFLVATSVSAGLILGLGLAFSSHLMGNDLLGAGGLARIADSLRLHLFVLSACLAAILYVLGRRRRALLGLVLALAGTAGLIADYRSRAVDPGIETDLTVLWFNAFVGNRMPTALQAAMKDSGADLIVVAEARSLRSHLDSLSEEYPYRLGCEPRTVCSMLVLSKLPLSEATLEDSSFGPQRVARFSVQPPGMTSLPVLAMHLVKPWYPEMNARDEAIADRQLAEVSSGRGPFLVIGDFNAAPWSRRLLQAERSQDLRHAAWPVATWPTWAGDFGIPIDHILLGGPRVSLRSLTHWGENLGSNHLGLLARIDLPAP